MRIKLPEFGMSWITIALIGFVVGGGATAGAFLALKPKPIETLAQPVVIVPDNSVAEKQQDVVLALTNLDLVEPLCTAEFIEAHGNELCRELFCRMQTNSIAGETSGAECERISNLNDTLTILKTCDGKDEGAWEACARSFRERK